MRLFFFIDYSRTGKNVKREQYYVFFDPESSLLLLSKLKLSINDFKSRGIPVAELAEYILDVRIPVHDSLPTHLHKTLRELVGYLQGINTLFQCEISVTFVTNVRSDYHVLDNQSRHIITPVDEEHFVHRGVAYPYSALFGGENLSKIRRITPLIKTTVLG